MTARILEPERQLLRETWATCELGPDGPVLHEKADELTDPAVYEIAPDPIRVLPNCSGPVLGVSKSCHAQRFEDSEGVMDFRRTQPGASASRVTALPVQQLANHALSGDNREIMRHSNGAIHGAFIESSEGAARLALFGADRFGAAMHRLAGPISGPDSNGDSAPATDSNQNGAYIAYVQDGREGKAGYVAHIPDPFGAPAERRINGPLTPAGPEVVDSFLQASRAYNTVVYGWRDAKSGQVYVGVSTDGIEFPPCQTLVTDGHVVRGPATGIHGDYVIYVYETTNPKFSPVDAGKRGGGYYAWSESGDAGRTWSDPAPLFPERLPFATGFTVSKEGDLLRSDLPIEAVAPSRDNSLQLLAWANPKDAYDSRVFALAEVAAAGAPGTASKGPNAVGLLAAKPIAVGGEWEYTVANRPLFQLESTSKYAGRTGAHYKYSALPGTPVRVVSYVDRAPESSTLEDRVAILVSTNRGVSFDHESTYPASSLGLDARSRLIISNSACCFADDSGEVWQDLLVGDEQGSDVLRHVILPIGLNASGLDVTLAW